MEDHQARARSVGAGARRTQPGGPAELAVARDRFANVGCEACHGGGKAHLEAADKKTGIARAVPEAICRGCHTADVTNGEFDYKKFLQAIVGPGHGGKT